MNGNKLFADTNAVLYLLSGDRTLADILEGKKLYLSFISELELLGYGKMDSKAETALQSFLAQCIIIDINISVKEEVVRLRKKYHVKLPDCIIMASAIYLDIPLITSDADFKKVEELNLLFYEKL